MFTKIEEAYIRERSSLAQWYTARNAIFGFTTIPTSVSIWELASSREFSYEFFGYIFLVVCVVVTQAFSAKKVAYHKTTTELLRKRLEYPPIDPGERDRYLKKVLDSLRMKTREEKT